MKFLLDEQLSPAIAKWMAKQGVEADHVARLGLLRKPDTEIAAYAFRHGYVVVTKDVDYLNASSSHKGPQVLWLTVGNVPNRVLIERLEQVWSKVMADLADGRKLVTVSGDHSTP